MNYKELISQEDLLTIDIYNTIHGSKTDFPRWFYEDWANSKENLVKLFDRELIIKKEVEFHQSIEEIAEEAARDIPEYQEFTEILYKKYLGWNPEYKLSDDWQVANLISYCIRELIDINTMIAGVTKNNHEVFLGGRTLKLPPGSKSMKALQKILTLIEFPNMELFEKLRQKVSNVSSKKTIKGTLCLSIHPMDFFTMSDNANGWDSCMSWANEGCHREGTLSFALGKDSVVAYLESSKEYEISDWSGVVEGTWNSKRWRQLIAINEDAIVTNRHYPFVNQDLEAEAVKMLRELAKENWEVVYDENMKEYDWSSINTAFGAAYSDISKTTSKYALSLNASKEIKPLVQFGGDAPCLDCRSLMESGEEGLVCRGCRGEFWCSNCESYDCGEPVWIESEQESICQYCYEERYGSCDSCGMTYHLSNLDSVETRDGCILTLCQGCTDDLYEEEERMVKEEKESEEE